MLTITCCVMNIVYVSMYAVTWVRWNETTTIILPWREFVGIHIFDYDIVDLDPMLLVETSLVTPKRWHYIDWIIIGWTIPCLHDIIPINFMVSLHILLGLWIVEQWICQYNRHNMEWLLLVWKSIFLIYLRTTAFMERESHCGRENFGVIWTVDAHVTITIVHGWEIFWFCAGISVAFSWQKFEIMLTLHLHYLLLELVSYHYTTISVGISIYHVIATKFRW